MSKKRKILILTANPKDTARLRFDEEVREIDEGLLRSRKRDAFDLDQKWAVRIEDLRRALLDHEPQIVHFIGHGSVDGIMLEDDAGDNKIVDPQGLAGLFKLFRNKVKCVLLNACYSELQAKAINEHIDYVIGMNKSISDRAAIEFSIGFYDALGAERWYDEAFEFGCNAIQLHGTPEHATPVLFVRPGALEREDAEAKIDPRSDTIQDNILIPDKIPEESREAYQLLFKKLKLLKRQYAIEADASRKFQLEYQIEEIMKDLKRLEEW